MYVFNWLFTKKMYWALKSYTWDIRILLKTKEAIN